MAELSQGFNSCAYISLFLFVSFCFSLVEPQNWYGGERGGGWEFKEEDGGFKKK